MQNLLVGDLTDFSLPVYRHLSPVRSGCDLFLILACQWSLYWSRLESL